MVIEGYDRVAIVSSDRRALNVGYEVIVCRQCRLNRQGVNEGYEGCVGNVDMGVSVGAIKALSPMSAGGSVSAMKALSAVLAMSVMSAGCKLGLSRHCVSTMSALSAESVGGSVLGFEGSVGSVGRGSVRDIKVM